MWLPGAVGAKSFTAQTRVARLVRQGILFAMPELPEVETVVRGLRQAGLEGARMARVEVRWARTVAGASPAAFARTLQGRVIRRIARRAKYIVCHLDGGGELLIHLRMTGRLRIEPPDTPALPHDRVVFVLDDKRQVHFHDTRTFGRFRLVDDAAAHLAALGPEPLDAAFTADALRQRLAGRRTPLKPLLLDQRRVAGLGNIYVDEALWAARLNPRRRADTLKPAEIKRLHAAIRDVLARAIAANGTTLGGGKTNFYSVAGRRGEHAGNLKVFRRTGEPCPRCGRRIVRQVVAQRGTHICPRCQPER